MQPMCLYIKLQTCYLLRPACLTLKSNAGLLLPEVVICLLIANNSALDLAWPGHVSKKRRDVLCGWALLNTGIVAPETNRGRAGLFPESVAAGEHKQAR